jgi:hypothetical protein
MKTCPMDEHRGTKANGRSLKILKAYNNFYYSAVL